MNKYAKILFLIATGPSVIKKLLTPIGGAFYFSIFFSLVYLTLKAEKKAGLKCKQYKPLRYILGIPLIGVGICTVIWTVNLFLRAEGTPVPFNPPPELIKDGPYAYVRNPMISGYFLILFGLGFVIGSPVLLLLFTPLFITANVLFIRKIEEPELLLRLGNVYREYLEKVPGYVPKV